MSEDNPDVNAAKERVRNRREKILEELEKGHYF
jgi:hypothetical protein